MISEAGNRGIKVPPQARPHPPTHAEKQYVLVILDCRPEKQKAFIDGNLRAGERHARHQLRCADGMFSGNECTRVRLSPPIGNGLLPTIAAGAQGMSTDWHHPYCCQQYGTSMSLQLHVYVPCTGTVLDPRGREVQPGLSLRLLVRWNSCCVPVILLIPHDQPD